MPTGELFLVVYRRYYNRLVNMTSAAILVLGIIILRGTLGRGVTTPTRQGVKVQFLKQIDCKAGKIEIHLRTHFIDRTETSNVA